MSSNSSQTQDRNSVTMEDFRLICDDMYNALSRGSNKKILKCKLDNIMRSLGLSEEVFEHIQDPFKRRRLE